MKVIGVTGGIGSGKSTVSDILQKNGAIVIDADKIARELVFKGSRVLEELTGFFGKDILNESGELDRKKLAAVVFKNEEKLDMLNRITHKHVAESIEDRLHSLRQMGDIKLVVLDVPIPVKHGFLDLADEIWVVVSDRESRISRVMSRSGYSYEEALQRISAQMSENDYIKHADKILYNNGSIIELEEKITVLLKEN